MTDLPEVTERDVVDAYRRYDRTVPEKNAFDHLRRAVAQGVLLRDVLNAVHLQAEHLKLWAILDLLIERKSGAGALVTRRPDAEVPPVLQERREDVQRRQDEARQRCDDLLNAMEEDELAGWQRDAEAGADKAKIPGGPMREAWIKGELRRRIARENGIEGL